MPNGAIIETFTVMSDVNRVRVMNSCDLLSQNKHITLAHCVNVTWGIPYPWLLAPLGLRGPIKGHNYKCNVVTPKFCC